MRLTLFTRVRKNTKALPLSLEDKALLKARNMAETIIVVSFWDYDSIRVIPDFILLNYEELLTSQVTWRIYLNNPDKGFFRLLFRADSGAED